MASEQAGVHCSKRSSFAAADLADDDAVGPQAQRRPDGLRAASPLLCRACRGLDSGSGVLLLELGSTESSMTRMRWSRESTPR